MIISFMALAVAPAAQTPTQPDQSPPIVVVGEQAKEKRVVCNTETPTGSLFANKVCRTVLQVEQNRAQSAKFMEEGSRIQNLNIETCQARNKC